MKNIDIVFFGSSPFVVPILDNILQSQRSTLQEIAAGQLNFLDKNIATNSAELISLKPQDLENPDLQRKLNLRLVVSQPDRTLRKKIISNTISDFARQNHLDLFTPESLNREFIDNEILKQSFDIGIVASYGQIISQKVLEQSKFGFLNWHPSKLPQYRGATPMQTALLEGREETALTWIEMTKEMDAGDIWLQLDQKIEPSETFHELANRMGQLGSQTWALAVALKLLNQNKFTFKPEPQNETKATFCNRLSKEDALIDPKNLTAKEVFNHWRAYKQFPGTKFFDDIFEQMVKLNVLKGYLNEEQSEILNSTFTNKHNGWLQIKNSGEQKTYLCCKEGAVEVEQITLENGKTIHFRGYQFG